MTVSVLSLGTELTRGELQNTNADWLAEQLTELGYEVTEMVTVDDDDRRIQATLARLSETHEAVVCTGGLGPTTDDRTTQCVAALLGVPLELDRPSLEHIRSLFEKNGVTFTPSNEKQARFPAGATILPNDRGSAPGFAVSRGSARAFFLPGVPDEMRHMFRECVVPLLPKQDGVIVCRRLRTYGLPESKLGELLTGLEEAHGVTIGYRASLGQVEVKVLSRGAGAPENGAAQARADRAFATIRGRLGNAVFTDANLTLEQTVGELLRARGQTLGLAESCTGGLVSQLITRHPGASDYYLGGICSYANSLKTTVLGVLPETLDRCGAVSESVVREMAQGARRILGTDIALALSGIAGPGGGTDDKPVGLVHWAVAGPDRTTAEQRIFRGDRARIQRRAAAAGLWSVRQFLLQTAHESGRS